MRLFKHGYHVLFSFIRSIFFIILLRSLSFSLVFVIYVRFWNIDQGEIGSSTTLQRWKILRDVADLCICLCLFSWSSLFFEYRALPFLVIHDIGFSLNIWVPFFLPLWSTSKILKNCSFDVTRWEKITFNMQYIFSSSHPHPCSFFPQQQQHHHPKVT